MEKLFVIGSVLDFENTTRLLSEKPNVEVVPYEKMMESSSIIASDAHVYLDFPYVLWDEHVENGSSVLYGCEGYGFKIKRLGDMIEDKLSSSFPNARFVNSPSAMVLERDKLLTKRLIAKNGLLVPTELNHDIDTVLEEIEQGNGVYIKARFGSMGKGISYFGPKKWTTNFNYDGKSISNHTDDKSWVEKEITGDKVFLERLLEHDVVVERAIKNPSVNGFKFDVRAHIIYGNPDPLLSYGRVTSNSSITNMSQGGKSVPFTKMNEFVPQSSLDSSLILISEAIKNLGFNYAGGDILFDGDNFSPVFLEANSFPGLFRSDKSFQKNVIDNLYNKIQNHDDVRLNQKYVV